MRAREAAALAALAALAAGAAIVRADRAEVPVVFAPAAEADGAVRAGAAALAQAQQLARRKQLPQAIAILERLVQDHPAAIHDCNLALAYLRAGELTGAQLAWDQSRVRGVAAPAWCEGDLARDLAKALRAAHYVPVTLVVSPAGATVEVARFRVRDLAQVWLPIGRAEFTASAPGTTPVSLAYDVAAPAGRVTLTAEPIRAPVVDAAPAAVPTLDAAAIAPDARIDVLDPPPPPEVHRAPRWPLYVSGGVAALGVIGGVVFHSRALDTKDRANQLVRGSAEFEAQRSSFGTERALALTGYAIGAAALGVGVWQWTRGRHPTTPAVGAAVSGDGAMLVFEGRWR